MTNGPVTDPHQASSALLGTSAEVFFTITYKAAMYMHMAQWARRFTTIETTGIGEAADVQK